MIEIIPSILTNDPNELRELMAKCEGVVDRISIDVIDGKFVTNKTIDPTFLFNVETNLKIDYQLMVEEPINWVEKCVRGQADRIIGHVELMNSQTDFVKKVQEVGAKVGLALDLQTAVEKIDQVIMPDVDLILLMSVPAGYGGQEFDDMVFDKFRKLSELRDDGRFNYRIQDDGGVTTAKINRVYLAGVDEVSIGRRLFEGDLADNIKKFQEAAHNLK